jgi:hypothetical protein
MQLETRTEEIGKIMANTLAARLARLEAKSDQMANKFVVVGDEAERDVLARAGKSPVDARVIIRADSGHLDAYPAYRK